MSDTVVLKNRILPLDLGDIFWYNTVSFGVVVAEVIVKGWEKLFVSDFVTKVVSFAKDFFIRNNRDIDFFLCFVGWLNF